MRTVSMEVQDITAEHVPHAMRDIFVSFARAVEQVFEMHFVLNEVVQIGGLVMPGRRGRLKVGLVGHTFQRLLFQPERNQTGREAGEGCEEKVSRRYNLGSLGVQTPFT